MIIPQKLVAGSQLTTSAATYYTAGTNVKAVITNMTLTNTTGTARTATVHVVSTGATETASNMIISARVIAAGETYNCPEAIGSVILATGTIRALAEANTAISLQVSGYEVT